MTCLAIGDAVSRWRHVGDGGGVLSCATSSATVHWRGSDEGTQRERPARGVADVGPMQERRERAKIGRELVDWRVPRRRKAIPQCVGKKVLDEAVREQLRDVAAEKGDDVGGALAGSGVAEIGHRRRDATLASAGVPQTSQRGGCPPLQKRRCVGVAGQRVKPHS